MGCNRVGEEGGGHSGEPGQTHLPLDQSHFPFLSLNLPLLLLLSFFSVLFKEKGYVMGKFNSIREQPQFQTSAALKAFFFFHFAFFLGTWMGFGGIGKSV